MMWNNDNVLKFCNGSYVIWHNGDLFASCQYKACVLLFTYEMFLNNVLFVIRIIRTVLNLRAIFSIWIEEQNSSSIPFMTTFKKCRLSSRDYLCRTREHDLLEDDERNLLSFLRLIPVHHTFLSSFPKLSGNIRHSPHQTWRILEKIVWLHHLKLFG